MYLILFLILTYILVQAAYSTYYSRKGMALAKITYTQDLVLGDPKDPPLKVFIDGDSVGAGVGATSFEKSLVGRLSGYLAKDHYVALKNESINGSKMTDMLLRNVPSEKQDLIILIVSSNDLFHFTNLGEFEKSTSEVLQKYAKLTSKLIIQGPGRVFDAPALPLPVRFIYKLQAPKYAAIIANEAKKYQNVLHVNPINPPIDLTGYGHGSSPDKFHPDDEGYRFWFDMLKPSLK